MTARAIITAIAGTTVLAATSTACGTAGAGHNPPQPGERRDFMFEVMDFKTPNQGGEILNLYFHYRYNPGIADKDLPDYLAVKKTATTYLTTTNLHTNPYWETLNQNLCQKIKHDYPIDAISCELQVHGNARTDTWAEPGYHASIDTIGGIEPLAIPGPGDH